jgi:uncharacterized protein YjbI with pentapeptide repeats
MDRDEALKLLKGGEEGIREWNQRRQADEAIPDLSLSGVNLKGADLSGADLRNANLSDADLRNANLSNADLSNADLSNADLRGDLVRANLSGVNLFGAELIDADLSEAILIEANLSGADLSQAKLSHANLSHANLSYANLSYANLSYANLRFANFSDANLSHANLTGATLVGATLTGATLEHSECELTTFAVVDLSEVRGLDSIKHQGPSTVGIDTLLRSKGTISDAFLRGCGVLDALIVQQRALVGAMQPIQFYSCFISYSSRDQAFAERLYADLQGKGVRCWYAPEDLKIGEKIRVGIDESIRIHDKLLLVLSKNSVASDWVEKEVETAMEKERQQKRVVLFPIRLDDAVMKIETGWPADIRRSRNIGDFKKWKTHDTYQKAFERLLRDLKAKESIGSKHD